MLISGGLPSFPSSQPVPAGAGFFDGQIFAQDWWNAKKSPAKGRASELELFLGVCPRFDPRKSFCTPHTNKP
jgi:hypothetical protein